MKKNNNVYLAQPWGGLGDNLGFSNLPRLYSEKNINFSVSFLNHERNKNIRKLVWKNNPYVKSSFSLKYPNIGSRKLNSLEIKEKSFNVVQRINIFHGFDPGDGFPDIYINNVSRDVVKYEKIVDINAFSFFNTLETIYDVKEIQKIKNKLESVNATFLRYPKLYKEQASSKKFIDSFGIDSLIEVLLSTNTFYCLNSGSHGLAAALKNKYGYPKKIICYLPDLDDNFYDSGHVYSNVEYLNTPGVKNDNIELPRKIKIYQGLIKKYFKD